MTKKLALIAGISGQDGAYLAKLLLDKGYSVIGTTRDSESVNSSRLQLLGIHESVSIISVLPSDLGSVIRTILQFKPNEIYNLAGQTSVFSSFKEPIESINSIANSTINWLEAIRIVDPTICYFNAGSSECFGSSSSSCPANENTPFSPKSPYAIAKASAFWTVKLYRDSYNLKCCTGILSNHESPLRNQRFVTQKIVNAARDIKTGKTMHLNLGNIDISRDWGWSPDYVSAIHSMLTINGDFEDFIVATGKTHSLREFIDIVFGFAGLNSRDHIRFDSSLLRPNDLKDSLLCADKIRHKLGWEPTCEFEDIAKNMYFNILF